MRKLILILFFYCAGQMFAGQHQCPVSVREYFTAIMRCDDAIALKEKEISKCELKLGLEQIKNNRNGAIVKAMGERHDKITYTLFAALALTTGFSMFQLAGKKRQV